MRRAATSALLLLAALLALAPAAGATTTTARVIGGTTASTSDAPWQALVLPAGYLCGGAILDEWHVVTAAHCVYDPDYYEVVAPSDVTVRAGITDRTVIGTGQTRGVTAVSVYPRYAPDLETGDTAVLTLDAPLTFDATAQPIALTDIGWRPVAGVTNLQLSGWGSTVARSPDQSSDTAVASSVLKVAKTIKATDACSSVYRPFDATLLLCAGQAGLDACQGDSGGPLAVQDGGVWKLAGIVTGGAGCGWDGYPGFYARVAEPGIHDFLASRGAGSQLEDPAFLRPPAITGDPSPGNTLTCDHGQAANAYGYSSSFTSGGVVAAYDDWITLRASDVGRTFSCTVVAYGLTGSVVASSAPVTVHAPAVAPTPKPVPAPSPYAPAPDTAAPVAKVLHATCSRGVCILDVRVTDPSPSAGIKGVDAKVETPYRTTCRVKGKRRRCTKLDAQRLRAAVTGTLGVYRIVTPHLRAGTHTFTLSASDTAGHRQVRPTRFKKKTR